VFGFRIKSWVAVLLNITLYAVFLSVSGFVLTKPFSLLAQFLLSTIVFFSFLLTILYVINAPMRRLFHINTLDAFSQVVRNWLYEDEELMENLRAISKRITTYMKFFSLSYGGKRLVVLVPKIHFGPFGSLGGSDLPRKLERYGVITFHGAATHDEDPLEDVSRAIVEKLKTGEVSERTVKLFEGKAGNARARALHFGDFALLFLTRAPYTTEDISYDFGAYLELLAKDVLGVEVAVIDEHNAENDEVMVIQGVSEAGREYVEAVRNLKFVKDIQPLFGYRKLVVNNSTVGSIHVLVFGEREFNVVLLDGNGVDRETKRCLEQVFDVVATTDSHMHNKVKGVILPVRLTDEECSQVLKAVNVQLERLRASNLHTSLLSYKALGPQMSVELSTTIGVTFTLTKYLLPLFLLWATVAFILLFS
jgi:predicted neutral ceramidase superfamily lipid hydrolase